jgi:hypothetical protein
MRLVSEIEKKAEISNKSASMPNCQEMGMLSKVVNANNQDVKSVTASKGTNQADCTKGG